MDTPRKTTLYNQIAKDFQPKQADMMICKYIEGIEWRIEELERKSSERERAAKELSEGNKATAKESKTSAKKEDAYTNSTQPSSGTSAT